MNIAQRKVTFFGPAFSTVPAAEVAYYAVKPEATESGVVLFIRPAKQAPDATGTEKGYRLAWLQPRAKAAA